jgi:inhibitor of cysteine peptidase
MKLIKCCFSLAILLFSLVALAGNTNETSLKVYTEDEVLIQIVPDAEFVIRLNSNISTGYSWFLREYDPELISVSKHSYIAPKTNLIGAPGFDEWTFKTTHSPKLTTPSYIRFVYARPWEKNIAKQVIFKLKRL